MAGAIAVGVVCPICYEEIDNNTIQPESCKDCKILYHNKCISEWIITNETCPHCRCTMWGKMLLNPITIIYYFTKLRSFNCIRFSNSTDECAEYDEYDDLPKLLTIINPPDAKLITDIKQIIHCISSHNLEMLFKRMLTVPTYTKLKCHPELLKILPSIKPLNYDICLLYAYIYIRCGKYQDIIDKLLD